MQAMLEGYQKADWRVFLLAMNTPKHYVPTESLPDLYKKIDFEAFDIDTDVKLVPTLRNFFLSKKPNHAERFYDRDLDKKLRSIIASFEPDIIQLESVYLSTYIPAIKEISKAQIISRLHNIEYQIWEQLAGETVNSFKKFYLKDLSARIKRFEINAWKQADILLPITERDAAIIREHAPGKQVVIVPVGIEIGDILKNNHKEKWVGYHIGAMDWIPNAEAVTWFLEEVWPDLHNLLPEFSFHFAGRSMPGSFEKYEQEGVLCAGEVADADEFIADKKILIVPLRSGGGIRVKTLEAMAAGKVVVSTSIGMQGINAQPGKHFLLADSKEDFIAHIRWIIENKDQAQKMAEAAVQLIESEYDQERIMQRLIASIRAVEQLTQS